MFCKRTSLLSKVVSIILVIFLVVPYGHSFAIHYNPGRNDFNDSRCRNKLFTPMNGQREMISHGNRLSPLRSQVDGVERGIVIQGLALLACVWFFSIPPEFRRAHFCFTDQCVANRERCYDCVTFSEWSHDVSEYYKNGGGVQFNFEVADETRAIFEKNAAFRK